MIAVAARAKSAGTPDGKARVGIRVQEAKPPYDGFSVKLQAKLDRAGGG